MWTGQVSVKETIWGEIRGCHGCVLETSILLTPAHRASP